jgi:hypothetical protein
MIERIIEAFDKPPIFRTGPDNFVLGTASVVGVLLFCVLIILGAVVWDYVSYHRRRRVATPARPARQRELK